MRFSVICTIFLFSLSLITPVFSAEPKEVLEKPITTWLQLGPIQTPMPLFSNEKNIRGKEFKLEDLLKYKHVDLKNWWPEAGETLRWNQAATLQWQSVSMQLDSFVVLQKSNDANPEIAYLGAYLETDRWIKVKLQVLSCHLFEVYLNGDLIVSKTISNKAESDTSDVKPGSAESELKLETGKHLLIIKTLRDSDLKSDWAIKAILNTSESWMNKSLNINLSPKHFMNIKHLLDGPKVAGVSISPNGDLVAVSMKQTLPPTDDSESWIELRHNDNGRLLQTFRGSMKLENIQWAPTGKRFSYVSSNKEKTTLWIVNLEEGSSTPLLHEIESFNNYTWSPDGTFIIFSITEKPEPDKTGVTRLDGMPDRWPWWRNRDFLYLVNVPEGTCRRLTSGKLSTELNSISPDGKKLLFTRSSIDYAERPYSKTTFYVLNLSTMTLDSLWTAKWSGAAQWSPDGKQILVTGGPSMFSDIGINLPPDVIPNDYDKQAYIYDINTKQVESITTNFNPSVIDAMWNRSDNRIYLKTIDRSCVNLYSYDVAQQQFEKIPTGVEVLNDFEIARNKGVAVYTGSSVAVPHKAYVIDLNKKKYYTLTDPGKPDFEDVLFEKVERWTFKNDRGDEIEGRIYYPPNFDSSKQYPCIVYYYGGTSPVTRDFGGRYPKELYAAQGYVVYVLQPSGAVGFGQEFSAQHVNDWGIIVADEIINGTTKFLEAHPFVDKTRVGCIGASYGGFMTMLIQTRTDMFAAAVSHAGISSLSSYWGEGYWGYLYSAVATANSFPWNRKDIYVDQSALFFADKIKTPLLLLHGMSDTNVPPGESIQLYAALKLLGKEVEFIQVMDQDHLILNYNKRILWLKSILAWFDRWLKDESQWWENLYPTE